MKILGRIILTLAVVALLAAIWAPAGPWWSWLLTSIVFLFVGAALMGQNAHDAPDPIEHDVPARPGRIEHGAPTRPGRTYGRKADQ